MNLTDNMIINIKNVAHIGLWYEEMYPEHETEYELYIYNVVKSDLLHTDSY